MALHGLCRAQFRFWPFLPVVTEGADIGPCRPIDDGWKKCIKKSILAKGRDINSLKYMTGDKYTLTNMKTALNNGTRMSVTNFSKWCELLGLDFEIRVMDNGSDPDFPLVNDIVFSSVTGKVYLEGTAEDPNKK